MHLLLGQHQESTRKWEASISIVWCEGKCRPSVCWPSKRWVWTWEEGPMRQRGSVQMWCGWKMRIYTLAKLFPLQDCFAVLLRVMLCCGCNQPGLLQVTDQVTRTLCDEILAMLHFRYISDNSYFKFICIRGNWWRVGEIWTAGSEKEWEHWWEKWLINSL